MGMDADEVATLFQRFGQLNKRIARDYGGSGLGLNISRELVRLLGGTIDVESEKGVGTRMTFGVRMGGVSAREEERWWERKRKEEREREVDGGDDDARARPPRAADEREPERQAEGISDSFDLSVEAATKPSPPSRFAHVLIAEASSTCSSLHRVLEPSIGLAGQCHQPDGARDVSQEARLRLHGVLEWPRGSRPILRVWRAACGRHRDGHRDACAFSHGVISGLRCLTLWRPDLARLWTDGRRRG